MIPVNEPLLGSEELDYVKECLDTSWISSSGSFIDRFEREWADYCGRKYGVAVSNGTVALELAVSALDLPAGKQVILPSFTIVSCLEAVLRNGLTPVLVDCDPSTFCMDIEDVERKISNETVAIMPVHIYGHPVNMGKVLDLASRHGLRVIEDSAEAHGAECCVDGDWKRCGSFGDVSAFSFYANKIVTCGEGGMVLTDDERLDKRLRSRRNLCFGEQRRFVHECRGWNFRLTNIQAAIGCAQIQRIHDTIKRKLDMASRYREGLKDLPLHLPYVEDWARTSVWMYAVLLHDSVAFDGADCAEMLLAAGVQTRPFFFGMHEQPAYRRLGLFCNDSHPVTEKIARRGLYLPSGQAITNEQIETVIQEVRNLFG